MKNEIWKPIKKYENLYQVSNFGNVKRIERVNSYGRKLKEKILIPCKDLDGYLRLPLTINGKSKTFKVHRLVAEAFVDNPKNKETVNHIDENKANNFYKNLEWLSRDENRNYGSRNKRAANSCKKKIKVIYRDGTYEIWDSTADFCREFGFHPSNVSDVLRGKSKTIYGVSFEYCQKT